MAVEREPRGRPARAEVESAALALIERHGAHVLATARRHSATREDAEDAYQRGLEIMLMKAPTTREDELLPWLKTVVKHEAFAIRRQRERATPPTSAGDERPTAEAATPDEAERRDRLRVGAEAMRRLKPQELRCLVLRAEGYSYREIAAITGFTYTKVNRCLTEGRRAFLDRVRGIEAGAECERLLPTLSALVDGEAGAEDLAPLRRHLKTCLACRARLRDLRDAPREVAALAPVGVAAVAEPGGLRSILESLTHSLAETALGQKAAAVAASAVVVGGGGAAAMERIRDDRGALPRAAAAAAPVAGARRPEAAPTAPRAQTPAAPVRARQRPPSPPGPSAPSSPAPAMPSPPAPQTEAPTAVAPAAPVAARPAPPRGPGGEFAP